MPGTNFNETTKPATTGGNITDWTAYTPTGTWTTNVTYTGQYLLVGSQMWCRFNVAVSGAVNNTALYIAIPAAYEIDHANMVAMAQPDPLGECILADAGVNAYLGKVVSLGTDTTRVRILPVYTGGQIYGSDLSASSPFTWANGDRVSGWFTVRVKAA